MSANTIIVLGPTPEAYFVGHGRRYFIENMHEGFTNHVKEKLNVGTTSWVSVNNVTGAWIAYDVAKDTYYYNADAPEDMTKKLVGLYGADFVTYPHHEDKTFWFMKSKDYGAWSAVLPDHTVAMLNATREKVDGFDNALTGMLFGYKETNIIMFSGGFIANLDDEIPKDDDKHPLVEVLRQYTDGWCIVKGSTLCSYDSRFFYLRFKRTDASSNEIKMHWNLPAHVAEKYSELRTQAEDPQEQMQRMHEEQMAMQLAMGQMNMQMQMSNAMAQQMHRGGLSILAAVTGGTVVEEKLY